MLPSRGRCHGVFLLSRAATLRERSGIDDWLTGARAQSTFMAHALDLDRVATGMVQNGLASLDNIVILNDALRGLSDQADRTTLMGIARLLLQSAPPFWLNIAVNNGRVSREYIPTEDLSALVWIDPDLDALLVDIHTSVRTPEAESMAKRIGDAAELFALAGLSMSGENPVHVAKLSDSYGYDIECRKRRIDRLEIKAASINTQKRFHISRNEFDKSTTFGEEWRLVQVIFSNRAFLAERLDASHIEQIRQLRFAALQQLVSPDTNSFHWTESALVTAPDEAWQSAEIQLDPNFVALGFRVAPSSSRPKNDFHLNTVGASAR